MITALQQVVVILKVQSTQFSPCCITKSSKTFCKQQKNFPIQENFRRLEYHFYSREKVVKGIHRSD
jgi:hypothetical protein